MATQSGVLRRFYGKDLPWPVYMGAKLVLANALLVLSAKIAVPLPWTPVPITLQTFGVLVIAVLFGARTSALAAALYLVEGAAGLPVFQPFGAPAAGRFFGPTAGYLLAFPFAAFLTGRLMEIFFASPQSTAAPSAVERSTKRSRSAGPTGALAGWLGRAAAMLPGAALMLLSGWSWLAALAGARAAFQMGVVPFLAGELMKIGAAGAIAWAVTRRE